MNMPTGVMTTPIDGGAGSNTLAVTFTNGADTIHVTHTNDIGISSSSGGSFSASNIHAVSLALGTGRDTITVDNLSGSSVTSLTIDVGANDHAADAVTLDGSDNGDTFTVSGSDPNAGIQIVHTVSTNVGWIQQIYVQHTVRGDGDTLTIIGGSGADTMDASLLGSPSSSSVVSAHPVDLVALTLMGGAGDDRLIGSPFNDVIDGGTSDAQGDTLTGGLGYDIFRSENATAVDTLVETQNTDMGLYGNIVRHRRRAREQRHDPVRDGRGRLRHRGRARRGSRAVGVRARLHRRARPRYLRRRAGSALGRRRASGSPATASTGAGRHRREHHRHLRHGPAHRRRGQQHDRRQRDRRPHRDRRPDAHGDDVERATRCSTTSATRPTRCPSTT